MSRTLRRLGASPPTGCYRHGRTINTRSQLGTAAPRPLHDVLTKHSSPTISAWKEQCREIRQKLCSEHLSGGLIFLAGGDVVNRIGSDVYHKFRPASNFLYVTGVTEPGFGCILDSETGEFTLLAPKVPEEAAVWSGGLPSLDDLAELCGADRCVFTSDLAAMLAERHAGRNLHTLPEMEGELRKMSKDVQASTDFLPGVLRRCRAVKTAAEVACLQRANDVSGAAHVSMWHACRAGMYEYQLEAVFVGATLAGGLPHVGYPAIVGSGPNAAVLHYERNSRQLSGSELVLVDAGAEFRGYTADISRTFPAGGTFTAQQRDVYDAVLDLQDLALSMMAPGVQWSEVEAAVRRRLLAHLSDLGLLRGGASLSAAGDARLDRLFMPHGLGHHLGLDVHDAAEAGPIPGKLAPGNVVTCEPGLYFMDVLMKRARANDTQAKLLDFERVEQFMGLGGVRIEDNVAVTPDGIANLTMSANVPKAASEVERAMGQGPDVQSSVGGRSLLNGKDSQLLLMGS